MMRRLLAVSIALLSTSGCASLTDRLDMTNAQLAETNRRLADTQAKLGEANQHQTTIIGQIAETNRRMDVIDQAILKFPGLRPDPAAPAPIPPAATLPAGGQ